MALSLLIDHFDIAIRKPEESFANPAKFLLWQDPLLAIMDPHFKGVDLSGHYAKLSAINGEYIRALPVDDFIVRAEPFLHEAWRGSDTFRAMAALVQERVKRLDEVPGMVDFLFLDDAPIDDASWAKAMKAPAADVLAGVIEAYGTCAWDAASLKAAAEAVGERYGLKPSKAQAPVRVAITGRSVGPPLYDAIEVLGRPRTIARLLTARARL